MESVVMRTTLKIDDQLLIFTNKTFRKANGLQIDSYIIGLKSLKSLQSFSQKI